MKKLGIIGWRGMVGSVLMERMLEEKDLAHFDTTFFSTSQAGELAPAWTQSKSTLKNAFDLDDLGHQDILLSCQGGDYTKEVYGKLRSHGWKGFWIDAASTLRMEKSSIIVLDPLNKQAINQGIDSGIKDFIGGNCTVSLMLMALGGLFENNLVEWATSMTYQAASGAGAKNMLELLQQMRFLTNDLDLSDKAGNTILAVEKTITARMKESAFPNNAFGVPLAANLIPWIDSELESGQSREEWKGQVEANKILGTNHAIPVDGTCVRVGAMRCHSQGITVKLKKSIPLNEVEEMIKAQNEWVEVVPNHKAESIHKLTPAYVSGSLKIPVGRLRKMTLGDEYLNAFTCGDQLLWGAAEPLRRVLRMLA